MTVENPQNDTPGNEDNGLTAPKKDETTPETAADTPAPVASNDDEDDMSDLFPDLEPNSGDTIESLRRDKEILLKQNASLIGEKTKAQLELQTAKKEITEMQERLNQADSNARQAVERVTRQAKEDNNIAIAKVIKAQIPVIDDIEIALNAITPESRAASKDVDTIARGFEITYKKLMAVFNKFGVKQIDPLNQTFDETQGHEAIGVDSESQGLEPGTVTKVAQKGYSLNGEIVRNALVISTPI